MSSDKKRYFQKRDVIEAKQEFPQISRFITARLLWGVFTTILYSCIAFFILIQLSLFFPAPERASSFSDALVNSPHSYRSHLLYLESLVIKNRLDEAQHESDFLKVSQKVLEPSTEELATFHTLQNEISARKIVFHTTIAEYNYWSEVLRAHPDYRDVLYRLGQRSYMLFDDQHTYRYIRDAVALDPHFEQGKKVLLLLQ